MTQEIGELNKLFVGIYELIARFEHISIQNGPFKDLSVTEMHTIEGVNRRGICAMGVLAAELGITVPTLSVAVKRLCAKGYIRRLPDHSDRRIVLLELTELGKKAGRLHRYFHGLMVKSAVSELEQEEAAALRRALEKLYGFFVEYLDENKASEGGK